MLYQHWFWEIFKKNDIIVFLANKLIKLNCSAVSLNVNISSCYPSTDRHNRYCSSSKHLRIFFLLITFFSSPEPKAYTHQAHHVYTMSHQYWCNIMTLHQHRCDIVYDIASTLMPHLYIGCPLSRIHLMSTFACIYNIDCIFHRIFIKIAQFLCQ